MVQLSSAGTQAHDMISIFEAPFAFPGRWRSWKGCWREVCTAICHRAFRAPFQSLPFLPVRRVEELEGELREVHRALALHVEQEAALKVRVRIACSLSLGGP